MTQSLWDTITGEAAVESPLWEAASRPAGERDEIAVFSPLGETRFALAVESIYEGYLLHYGRPRLFRADGADGAVLLGDYLYAHGLVRLSSHGNVDAVANMAELISLCTQLRAEDGVFTARLDGAAWAATTACLASGDSVLEGARSVLRLERDSGPLAALAARTSSQASVDAALAAHARLVE